MNMEQLLTPVSYGFSCSEPAFMELPLSISQESCQQVNRQVYSNVWQVVAQIQNDQIFVDLSIPELIKQGLQMYQLDPVDVPVFAKILKKKKNILKRRRAKTRKHHIFTKDIQVEQNYRVELLNQQLSQVNHQENEMKKQRNRMLAQLSRDKKKMYISTLETKNRLLSEETENLKKQNEILNKQVCEKSPQSQNKFLKLILLLGIVFFLYIIKDAFNMKQPKNSIEKHSIQTNSDFVNEIRNQINLIDYDEFENEKQNNKKGKSIKQQIVKKITNLSKQLKGINFPSSLMSNLQQIKCTFSA